MKKANFVNAVAVMVAAASPRESLVDTKQAIEANWKLIHCFWDQNGCQKDAFVVQLDAEDGEKAVDHTDACYWEGIGIDGRPHFWDDETSQCLTPEDYMSLLMDRCVYQGGTWYPHFNLEYSWCSTAEENSSLVELRLKDPTALTFRFNGMSVDLFKRTDFDLWFDHHMAPQAPQQVLKWKTHFDKWADKRVSRVLSQQDSSKGIDFLIDSAVFDQVKDQLEGVFDHLKEGSEDAKVAIDSLVVASEDQMRQDLQDLTSSLSEIIGTLATDVSESISTQLDSQQEGVIFLKEQETIRRVEEPAFSSGLIYAAIAIFAGSAMAYKCVKSKKVFGCGDSYVRADALL